MKNTTLFLLPLFLLLPAATQCMEQEIVFQPKTMQGIRNIRNAIYKESLSLCNNDFDSFVLQDNWVNFLTISKEKRKENNHEYFYYDCMLQKIWNNDDDDQYSFFGSTAIAIKNKKLEFTRNYKAEIEIYLTSHKIESVSFDEKKKHIYELLTLTHDTGVYYDLKITPTIIDKQLALLEKYERCTPQIKLIVQTYLNLKNASLLSEIKVPQEIISLITLLIWNTEESLF